MAKPTLRVTLYKKPTLQVQYKPLTRGVQQSVPGARLTMAKKLNNSAKSVVKNYNSFT